MTRDHDEVSVQTDVGLLDDEVDRLLRASIGTSDPKDAFREERSRLTNHDPRWFTTTMLPGPVRDWTDVLVDVRETRHPLPLLWRDWTEEELTARSVAAVRLPVFVNRAKGWGLDYMVMPVRRGDGFGGTTFTRFTAPDGFRFTIITGKRAPSFAAQQMTLMLPTMQHIFSGRHRQPLQAICAGSPLATYSLAGLREPFFDPSPWLETIGVAHSSQLMLNEIRVMLGWSAASIMSASDAWRWCAVGGSGSAGQPPGMSPVHYLRWRECVEDVDLAGWVHEFGLQGHMIGSTWALAGFTSTEAAQWKGTASKLGLLKPADLAPFHEAGLNPTGLGHLLHAIDPGFRLPDAGSLRRKKQLKAATEWLRIKDPGRRLAYVGAGVGVDEAVAFESSEVPPTLEQLAMLRGLLLQA